MASGDYDNDGCIDLYHLGGDLGTNKLLRNNGDGTFTDVAAAAGVALSGEWNAGATFGITADIERISPGSTRRSSGCSRAT